METGARRKGADTATTDHPSGGVSFSRPGAGVNSELSGTCGFREGFPDAARADASRQPSISASRSLFGLPLVALSAQLSACTVTRAMPRRLANSSARAAGDGAVQAKSIEFVQIESKRRNDWCETRDRRVARTGPREVPKLKVNQLDTGARPVIRSGLEFAKHGIKPVRMNCVGGGQRAGPQFAPFVRA